MTEAQKGEIEALKDLLESRGWSLFGDLVRSEIDGEFAEHITRALANPEQTIAVDKMRQIAAVREAGKRWLSLPKKRLETLQQSAAQETEPMAMGRRPAGL